MIWVWGLVYCLFNVRNVDPSWLLGCNGCRSPCTVWGYLDDVNALNDVVNTFKQKLLVTTLAAGLFFEGSYLRPSGLKCGPIFQRDPQKVPQQTSEVCKSSVARFQAGEAGKESQSMLGEREGKTTSFSSCKWEVKQVKLREL